MSETRTPTRVQQIAMTYQSSYRSVSSPTTRSQGIPVPRKPPANYHAMPATYRGVTQTGDRTSSLSTSTAPGTASSTAPLTPTSTNSTNASRFQDPTDTLSPYSLTQYEIDHALKTCLDVQKDAVKYHNKRTFAAILLGPNNSTVLQTHFSISHVQHAESELARSCSIQYSIDYLSQCTLVSTWEPCAMCAGTIYWAGIGKVLYAASETKLRDLTGPNNNENMTMNLPCRTVLNAGQRQVEVIGPIKSWEEIVVEESKKWWKDHAPPPLPDVFPTPATSSVPGSFVSTPNGSRVTVVRPQETMLGQMNEDGEYRADLKVDWMI